MSSFLGTYRILIMHVYVEFSRYLYHLSIKRGGGGGGRVQPKCLGKLCLEIGVYQKAAPIGGTFGEVSGPEMGVVWSLI